MPILCRTIASADEPVLSMVVEIELALLRDLVLEFDAPPVPRLARSARTVFSAPLAGDLEDAAARLLACLNDERRTRALARQIIQVLDSLSPATRTRITDAMKVYERDVLKDVTWQP